jgi:hypothetical protein
MIHGVFKKCTKVKNTFSKIYLIPIQMPFNHHRKEGSSAIMKKIFFILCLFCVSLLLPVAAAAVGNISVNSTPPGAMVYLDGTSTGTITPAKIESVTKGSHIILLRLTGYRDYIQSVTVNNNQTTNISAILVLSPTAPPTISTITPAYGFNNSMVSITNLSGTGFSSGATVKITKAGQTNISATEVSVTSTKITCNFNLNGKTAGLWNVVVTNSNGQSATKSEGFEIRPPPAVITLSSITPNYGMNNSIVTITNLAGTGFLSGATIKLKKTGYNDIPGSVTSVVSSIKITGTFDLHGRTLGSYEVCVENGAMNSVCGLVFTVYSSDTPINGSIYIESYPSVALVYVSSDYKGKTPLTVYNVTPGTYTLLLQKSGYLDWSGLITVTAGNRTYVTPRLPPEVKETTAIITVPTKTTTETSTIKVPTVWPSATTTPASPVSILAILGAVGVGLIVLRKR